MEGSTRDFLHSLVGQGLNPLRLGHELTVTMAALTLVELGTLATAPGVEVSLLIDGSTVVVSTVDLGNSQAFETRYEFSSV